MSRASYRAIKGRSSRRSLAHRRHPLPHLLPLVPGFQVAHLHKTIEKVRRVTRTHDAHTCWAFVDHLSQQRIPRRVTLPSTGRANYAHRQGPLSFRAVDQALLFVLQGGKGTNINLTMPVDPEFVFLFSHPTPRGRAWCLLISETSASIRLRYWEGVRILCRLAPLEWPFHELSVEFWPRLKSTERHIEATQL